MKNWKEANILIILLLKEKRWQNNKQYKKRFKNKYIKEKLNFN